MLNYQGIAHYQQLVICGKVFGKDWYKYSGSSNITRFITEFITSYYRSLVRVIPLSIKALHIALPTLPIINTYITYNFLKEGLWG
jgi:hypothetical protein